ncbi:uncharacterized protein [Ptychodera flava]|uniref:uncharacterized protein n=1 Tax=Ptychodera flava TaxID=63121 RepID=UPI00396A55F9
MADVFEPNGEKSLECIDGAVGRYLTLTKEGSRYPRAIYLCELEVYGQEPDDNLALGKPVTGVNLEQGTLDTLPNLVDGKANICADSGPMVKQPSFQIDLGCVRLIKSVKLVFPSGCTEALSKVGCGFKNTVIKVSKAKDGGVVCGRLSAEVFEPNGEKSLECIDGAVGRYLTLTKEGSRYPRAIYLCELEVYGRRM